MIIPAYHAIVVSLASGTLVAAWLLLTFRFWFKPEHPMLVSLWKVSDRAGLYAAAFGTITLIAAFATGMLLWPIEATLASPIAKNKILMAALAVVSWVSFLAVRFKSGEDLWNTRGIIPHAAWMMSLSGLVFLLSTSSVGGDIAGIPSGYEEIAMAFGFQTRYAVYFPTWVNGLLWLVGIVVLLRGISARSKAR